MRKLPDKWLYFPILVLFVHFIYRLINQSQILKVFPLDYTNDWVSYMTHLTFLDKCGYSNLCPYWYNGIVTLKFSPPGWYFFTWPLHQLTKNVLFTSFISLLLMFLIGFLFFYFFGRAHKFSFTKISTFFILFFGNAIVIGNFIRLGRVNELFAWMIFVPFAFILLKYKDHRIDKNFFWIILFFSIIMISHQAAAILSSILLLGLFLIKKGKEKLSVVLAGLAAFLLSSFWTVPYALNFFNTEAVNVIETINSFSLDKSYIFQNLATWIVSLSLFIIFYFYWSSYNKSKKELIFFSPTLIIAFLLFTGLTFYIPILKFVFPDSHLYLFIFLSIYMLFKIDYNILNKTFRMIIFLGFIILPLISIGINVIHTPYFIIPGDLERDTIGVLNEVEGRFIMLTDGFYPTSYTRAYYSYAAIYLDKYTSSGFSQQYVTQEYFSRLMNLIKYFKEEDMRLLETLSLLNTTEIISYDEGCEKLERFDFEERFKKGRVCLFVYK